MESNCNVLIKQRKELLKTQYAQLRKKEEKKKTNKKHMKIILLRIFRMALWTCRLLRVRLVGSFSRDDSEDTWKTTGMGTDEKSVISHVGPWVAVMTHRFAAR
jgi:hypothetical protein